jgi:hypothetical protein
MNDVLTTGLARVVFQAWRLNGCMVGGHDGTFGMKVIVRYGWLLMLE